MKNGSSEDVVGSGKDRPAQKQAIFYQRQSASLIAQKSTGQNACWDEAVATEPDQACGFATTPSGQPQVLLVS